MRISCLIGLVFISVFVCGCMVPMPVGAPKGVKPAETGEVQEGPGASIAKPEGNVLARGDDVIITEEMLEDRIKTMPPRRRIRFKTQRGKENLLKSMVETELLYRECERKGIDKDSELIARLESFKKGQAVTLLRARLLEKVEVDEEEMRAEYKGKIERFKTPKRVRVSQIVFLCDEGASPKDISAIEKRAKNILERARKGEDFARLAKDYSLDQVSAARGGDIGFVSRRMMPAYAYEASMALSEKGDISDLVKGDNEVRILKATEVTPEKIKPFEEVKPWIERSLSGRKKKERWKKYVEELKENAGVEIYEDRISEAEEKTPARNE